jgi:hypothetical protein
MSEKILGLETDPTLTDLILEAKRDVKLSMNCIQLGTIESYSKSTNMASVSVNFKRKLADGTIADYPILADCPVFIPSGGNSCLTFPITKGDQCIILFNDRNIDNWYLKGEVKEPANSRCHDIADGIVLVGVRNLVTAAASNIPPSNSVCLDGGIKKVAVKNTVTNLKTLIDSLITVLDGFVTVGSATTQTTSPATKALLVTLKAQFATLLDEGIT